MLAKIFKLSHNIFMVRFTIITLFEDALRPYLETSMLWKAKEKGIVTYDFVNLRDFGLGPHKSVDDTPYGGGDGMLLRCEPVYAAIEFVKATSPDAEVILPTPVGQIWTQALARQFAGISTPDYSTDSIHNAITKNVIMKGQNESTFVLPSQEDRHYVILCPHYEGYDERILKIVDYKISLGNYILTGGELPALIIIDSIIRLLPGVLGGDTSADIESFSNPSADNIEFPQYTKPYDFRGDKVPDILLSGNHGEIAKWRKEHTKTTKSC